MGRLDKIEELVKFRDVAYKIVESLPLNIGIEIRVVKFEDHLIVAFGNEINIYDSDKDGIFGNTDKFKQFLLDQIELHIKNRNLHNLSKINEIRANITKSQNENEAIGGL